MSDRCVWFPYQAPESLSVPVGVVAGAGQQGKHTRVQSPRREKWVVSAVNMT